MRKKKGKTIVASGNYRFLSSSWAATVQSTMLSARWQSFREKLAGALEERFPCNMVSFFEMAVTRSPSHVE